MKSNQKVLTAAPSMVTKANLQQRCWARGHTIKEFAEGLRCSRQAIYFALEKPTRFSRIYRLIQERLS